MIQVHINCEGGEVAPLIFYNDVTSLSKNTKVIGHLLVLSIVNIFYENKHFNDGHCLLAICEKFY